MQEARALANIDVDVLQRFDEAADHGERRLELVRHAGDEIAAHASDRFHAGDVARQQELLVVRKRHELQRKRAACLAIRLDDDRRGVIAARDVAAKLGLANEIGDGLSAILGEIEAKLQKGAPVRPMDAICGIEHHDAVGNGRRRLAKALDDLAQVTLVRVPCTDPTVDRCQRRGPDAAALGHVRFRCSTSPRMQSMEMKQMKGNERRRAARQHDERESRVPENGAQQGDQRHRGRRTQRAPGDPAHPRPASGSRAASAPGRDTNR